MTPNLMVRLAVLEAAQTAAPVLLTPEEMVEAARRYEASIYDPEEPNPRARTYWATATLHQLAADYDAMLKGASAPWD